MICFVKTISGRKLSYKKLQALQEHVNHVDTERRLMQARYQFLLAQIDLHAKIARGE